MAGQVDGTAPLADAPVLTTKRLILRAPQADDLPAFAAFMTSAPAMAAQGETVSEAQAWFGFLIGIGHWHMRGYGFFMLEEKATGTPVGRVGLIKHADWPEIELAWHLFEGAEGKGYATEAAQAVKDWAQRDLGLTALFSYIDRTNTRSQAVAKRLGAKRSGEAAPHEPQADTWVHQFGQA